MAATIENYMWWWPTGQVNPAMDISPLPNNTGNTLLNKTRMVPSFYIPQPSSGEISDIFSKLG